MLHLVVPRLTGAWGIFVSKNEDLVRFSYTFFKQFPLLRYSLQIIYIYHIMCPFKSNNFCRNTILIASTLYEIFRRSRLNVTPRTSIKRNDANLVVHKERDSFCSYNTLIYMNDWIWETTTWITREIKTQYKRFLVWKCVSLSCYKVYVRNFNWCSSFFYT